MTHPDDRAPEPAEPFEAPPLIPEQAHRIQVHLSAVERNALRVMTTLGSQHLLIQHVANVRALRTACHLLLTEVEPLDHTTLIRYVVRDGPSCGFEVVDLNSFRAPTDLRGLEP